MKYTTNYNLKKPEPLLDFYNKENDNGNMDIIDAELKNLSDNKVTKVTGKDLSTEDYTTEEKNKLAGVAPGANDYVHPSSHPASMIVEDIDHRFATDVEKAYWNGLEALLKVYADAAAAGILDSAPEALNTLNELAAALGDDPNFATTITTLIGTKLGATENAVSASKLLTARTISLGGDASGSASFNGTSNITITVTVNDDSHNHVIGNVDGLQTALDGKSSTSHNHSGVYEPTNANIVKKNVATTMAAIMKAQNNTSYTTGQLRNITLSTADASGGSNGDVWIKYSN